jgi:ribosome-associated translation inhibitor RaiA
LDTSDNLAPPIVEAESETQIEADVPRTEIPAPVRQVVPRANCQIAFVGMTASEAPRAEVHAWLARLGLLTAPMTEGRVVIEAVDHDRKERRYRVRMDLTMPRGIVTVGHDHPNNGAHEDIYVAIRNAFRAGRRELEAYSSRGAPAPVELPGSI